MGVCQPRTFLHLFATQGSKYKVDLEKEISISLKHARTVVIAPLARCRKGAGSTYGPETLVINKNNPYLGLFNPAQNWGTPAKAG